MYKTDFYEKMRTGSLICWLVRKCLCVSISRGKPSIYFLLNIGYVVYVWGGCQRAKFATRGAGCQRAKFASNRPLT